jgi:(4S)-4-hydroxy-5-phosphonooxypentane-2,3-dione isomerase
MFVVTVEFRIHQSNVAEFHEAILAQSKNSLQKEKGCKLFEVLIDPEDPCVVFLYEVYTDRAAFDVHCSTEHFQDFSRAVTPWINAKHVATWERLEKP